MLVLPGSGAFGLYEKLCKVLGTKPSEVKYKEFSDKEKYVELLEDVQHQDVFVLQSLSTPVNDNLMELILLVDALKRSSARRVNIISPYIGYSRQDRCSNLRTSLSLKVVADIISQSRADKLFTVDLHSEQTQGLFDLQLQNLSASSIFVEEILLSSSNSPLVVVSPDCGGISRARTLAQKLGCNFVIAGKIRQLNNTSRLLGIDGNVEGAICVIWDDIIDTGTTVSKVAERLKLLGASKVYIYATHPVISKGDLGTELKKHADGITVTDTISLGTKMLNDIRVISIAGIIAEAINKEILAA